MQIYKYKKNRRKTSYNIRMAAMLILRRINLLFFTRTWFYSKEYLVLYCYRDTIEASIHDIRQRG